MRIRRPHAHAHTTVGPTWDQMLVEAGGKDLLMLTNNNGTSCLIFAAYHGHTGAAKVRRVCAGVCRTIDRKHSCV